MIVIIDNGHGKNTGGKCSPDKSLLEYKWTREIARMLSAELSKKSVNNVLLVPEETDTPLSTRVRKANKIYLDNNKEAILISIHNNAAAGDGSKWTNANGFSVWVAPEASSNSKKLAKIFLEKAEQIGLKGNRSVPKEKYWVGNFAILRDTKCPAVLTENLFLDNKEDVKFLLSDEGKRKIVQLHVDSITEYIKELKSNK